mmetsp:Transcript_10521/g.27869  ORF Transcript_10521/g.27869 Transcript_10521/m.27869 type:complete len:204 (+) Transcript_10521:1024-1635(+)
MPPKGPPKPARPTPPKPPKAHPPEPPPPPAPAPRAACSLRSTAFASSLFRCSRSALCTRVRSVSRGMIGASINDGAKNAAESARFAGIRLAWSYRKRRRTRSTAGGDAPAAESSNHTGPSPAQGANRRPDASMSASLRCQPSSGAPSALHILKSMSRVSLPGNAGRSNKSSAIAQPAAQRSISTPPFPSLSNNSGARYHLVPT